MKMVEKPEKNRQKCRKTGKKQKKVVKPEKTRKKHRQKRQNV